MKMILCLEVLVKFMLDFVVAVIHVASWIFRPNRKLKPAIVRMPIDIQSEWGLWILSLIIFLVPGSMIVEISVQKKLMYVHFFHTEDPDQSVAYLKQRFERKLQMIFGERRGAG